MKLEVKELGLDENAEPEVLQKYVNRLQERYEYIDSWQDVLLYLLTVTDPVKDSGVSPHYAVIRWMRGILAHVDFVREGMFNRHVPNWDQTYPMTNYSAAWSHPSWAQGSTHRYTLWRVWDRKRPHCMFIGANPSTATEFENDPTVTRCEGYARNWQFGGLCMTNVFAYRSTDPKGLNRVKDPVGPDNDRWLRVCAEEAGIVIAAWGVIGARDGRDKAVLGLLEAMGKAVHCLGVTKGGYPRHPLYLAGGLEPTPYPTPK